MEPFVWVAVVEFLWEETWPALVLSVLSLEPAAGYHLDISRSQLLYRRAPREDLTISKPIFKFEL